MKKSQSVPDELLHAYVDDELDAEERQYVLDVQVKDAGIEKEICELRKLKDLLKSARPVKEEITGALHFPKKKYYLFNHRLVAMPVLLLLVLLVVAGIFFNQGKESRVKNIAMIYPDVKEFIETHTESRSLKLVLHINRADRDSAKHLFAQLNYLLQTTQDNNRMLRVEVVASGPGLSLVRKNKSPYPEKIREIRNHYDNVVFVACQSTLDRLVKVKNKEIQILPDAMITTSGPELIELRKSQGWAYIKI